MGARERERGEHRPVAPPLHAFSGTLLFIYFSLDFFTFIFIVFFPFPFVPPIPSSSHPFLLTFSF